MNLNLPKRWESSVGFEGRLIANSSVYRGSYFTGELGRPFGKHLSVYTNYRLAKVTGAVSHRVGVGAELEAKKGPLTFSLRPMFQYQRRVLDDADQGSQQVLRARIRVKGTAIRRVTLYGSVEPYFAFTGVYPVDNWRNVAGVQWEFRKDRNIDLYYIYRADYAKIYNRAYHIFGAEFSIDLKFSR